MKCPICDEEYEGTRCRCGYPLPTVDDIISARAATAPTVAPVEPESSSIATKVDTVLSLCEVALYALTKRDRASAQHTVKGLQAAAREPITVNVCSQRDLLEFVRLVAALNVADMIAAWVGTSWGARPESFVNSTFTTLALVRNIGPEDALTTVALVLPSLG